MRKLIVAKNNPPSPQPPSCPPPCPLCSSPAAHITEDKRKKRKGVAKPIRILIGRFIITSRASLAVSLRCCEQTPEREIAVLFSPRQFLVARLPAFQPEFCLLQFEP